MPDAIPAQSARVSAEALDYIRRAAACIKVASQISPHLVTRLGTPHCLLQDLMADLELVEVQP